jgi:hypothetical protein
MKRFALLMCLLLCIIALLPADEFVIRASDKLTLSEYSFQTANGDWIVFYTGHSTLSESIFCHKVSATGMPLTGEALPVAYKNDTDQRLVKILPTSDGNFIVVWHEVSNYNHIYMQKVSPELQNLWADEGVKCVDSLSDACRCKVLANSIGGLIVAYQDEYFYSPICAQNYDSDGNKLWDEAGVILAGSESSTAIGDIVPYPQGGFLLRFWAYFGYNQTSEVWRYSDSGVLVDDTSLVPTDLFFKGLGMIVGPVNGEYLIYADPDAMLEVNKVSANGELLLDQNLVFHCGYINDIKLLDDGKVAFVARSGANGGIVCLYVLSPDLELLWSVFEEQHPGYSWARINVCSDGRFLLTWDRKAQLYDADGTRLFSEPQLITADSGHDMLALPAKDSVICLWNYYYNTRQRIKLQAMKMDGSLTHLPNGIILEDILAGGCPDSYYAEGFNYCFNLGGRFLSFWTDTRHDGSYYYQLFDPNMQPLLEPNGRVALSQRAEARNLLHIYVSEGNRLHFIYGRDYGSPTYLQAIDFEGNLCYAGNGIEIELADEVVGEVGHVTYVFWTRTYTGHTNEIMGQKYVDGQAKWGANGMLILPYAFNHMYRLLGFENGMLIYSDSFHNYQSIGPTHLKALMFDTYGLITTVGGDDSVLLSSEPVIFANPLIGTGTMGDDLCLIVRLDSDESTHSYILQKVNSRGDRLWGSAGISFNDGCAIEHSIVTDNALCFLSSGASGYNFHSVDAEGAFQTPPGGTNIIPASYAPKEVDFATFEDGSMICVFNNNNLTDSDIFYRRINADGTSAESAPVVICDARNIQSQPRVATYFNTALITWKDHRAGLGITGLWGNTVQSCTPIDDALQTPIQQAQIIGNYPNPFNPSTTISYDIAVDGAVKLDVYNIKGQLVNTLVNEPKARGKHQVVWNGKDHSGKGVASGIYFVHLSSNSRSSVHKMVLMK